MRTSLMQTMAAAVVIGIGSLQMAGDLTGSRTLKGLGAATAASPLPKVFCDVRGYEPFAADFHFRAQGASGVVAEKAITPELYQQLGGAYNRRNAYGAALSYAPRLPEPLWRAVASYGLSPNGPLRTELGLPPDTESVTILIETRTHGRNDSWTLQPLCKD